MTMDVCPACGGIWLPGDELKQLIACDQLTLSEIEAPIRPHVEQRRVGPSKLLCPDNNVLLDEYHYMYDSPVLIHSCETCGGMFIHAEDLPMMQQWCTKSHEAPSKEEATRIAVGMDVANHEAFMMRQQHLQAMLGTLSSYRPGWWGLV
jgi:Zn-finger nucleic acid-binding protein